MIVQLEGKLIEATPLSAVVDVQGIGYEVHIPVTTAERLPGNGNALKLYIYAVYREDSQALYGFIDRAERDFFRLLTEKVSGIGPKIALSMMSKLSLPMLQSAIANGDASLLAQCPGIGKKTAERVIVELRDKVAAFKSEPTAIAGSASMSGSNQIPMSHHEEAVMAMLALGYKADVADRAVRKAREQLGDNATTETLVRAALR
jgi:Holliday junction DNA helicase RuvA|tara:strand:+ start:217 stop:828 length:612 start_codon:yes stop_codon:yes gene_type:complete